MATLICRYCHQLLQPCPRGPACPGSHPGHASPCTDCRWGLVCPTHGWRWPAGHHPPTPRPRPGSIGIPT